jgi:hypothetical protein
MHRLPNQAAVRRFRLTAFVLCLRHFLAFCAVSIVINSFIASSREWTLIGFAVGALSIALIAVQWLLANRTKCPLCLTPVLAKKQCSKHRKARTFFASHRLLVALSILIRGSFVCPYCGEPTAMEPRPKPSP